MFKSPTGPPWKICSGPDGGLFVALMNGNILLLDNSFNIINRFNVGEWSPIGITNIGGVNCNAFPLTLICYLPAPHNTMIVNKVTELRAVSLRDAHQVCSQPCEGFGAYYLLYCPQHDIILASCWQTPYIRIVDPTDGSTIQTIEFPNIVSIGSMCLCNDQIVMLQRPENDSLGRLLSYYSLKS